MLEYHLDNQLTRLILKKKGAYGWVSYTCSTFRSRYQLYYHLNGVITLPDGTAIAVETERSLKTKAHYHGDYHQPFVDPHAATLEVRFLYRTHPADETRD